MTEIESQGEMSRHEVANYLREFAAQLDKSEAAPESQTRHDRSDGDPRTTGASDPLVQESDDPRAQRTDDTRVTFMVGDDSATVDPPETVTFEVEVDTDSSFVGTEVEHEITFEIAWESEKTDENDEDLEIR